MSENKQQYWAVVPAAGIGKRMGTDVPKQYLVLAGKTVIEHSILRLQAHPALVGTVVALNAEDRHWNTIEWQTQKPLFTVAGGKERADSVLNALNFLEQKLDRQTWVLVHDAARPCVRAEAIDALVTQVVESGAVGGLLGTRVRDTMKRCDVDERVLRTVEREHLWHAHTPQMFRLGQLRTQLQTALGRGLAITDEASAMEAAGYQPLMVEGGADNIKITQPDDLELARFFLEQMGLNAE